MNAAAEDVIIEAHALRKVYRVYHQFGRGWLKSLLLPFADPDRLYRDVTALDGVDLRVRRGEVLGILGRNGAGKSTLLKLVSGLSRPTSGEISVRGEVRALLSLGVGFHHRFTGRENIVFGSMAMGIPRKTALERVPAIIEFSELGDAIDLPVQFYSSGMRSRLAASVAFQDEPEILIVDEALAAGDGYFVNKCRHRISEICGGGSTVLFVTHGVGLIERMCTRAMILVDGRMLAEDEPSVIVARYRRMLLEQEEQHLAGKGHQYASGSIDGVSSGDEFTGGSDEGDLSPDGERSGLGTIEVLEIDMCDADGVSQRVFGHGQPLELRIRFRTRSPIRNRVRFFVQLFSEDAGVRLAETGSVYLCASTGERQRLYPSNLDGTYRLRMTWPKCQLGGGTYYWSFFFAPIGTEIEFETPALYYVQVHRACPFRSVSFPGEEWAIQRRSILEPETEFELEPIVADSAVKNRA